MINKTFSFLLIFSLLLAETSFALGGWTGSAVTKAANEARLQIRDDLETKIAKVICYLDREKLYRSDPEPPGNDLNYGLDTRTAEEVLEQMPQKKGGHCGSYAVAVTSLLLNSEISQNDLRIVMAGDNVAMKEICPSAKRPLLSDPRGNPIENGLVGHVFVLFRAGKKWKLANTTNADCKKLAADVIDFMSPEQIERKMADGPLSVPTFDHLKKASFIDPQTGKSELVLPLGLTIVGAWLPKQYPEHTFQTRYNILASGSIESNVCRYGSSQIANKWP